MRSRPRSLVVAVLVAAVVLGVSRAEAGLLDGGGSSTTSSTSSTSSTTTTLLPSGTSTTTTSTTAPPQNDGGSGGGLDLGGGGSTPAPEGSSTGEDGDGTASPEVAQRIGVPAEAQRIIDSVVRSGPSSSRDLDEAMASLVALGLTPEQAYFVGFGRFIIAGPANYSHDWLFPRYGPGFRFHLGTDVFAAYGTPVRSPVDGIAQVSDNRLGGLVTKVYMADGTYFYLAHLSGVPPTLATGEPVEVKTGEIVGYVGTSGNAVGTPPHVHVGIYPQGGPAIDPKPILDGFLADARARFPEVLAYYQQQLSGEPVAPAVDLAVDGARGLRSTDLLRPFTAPVREPGLVPTDVLLAAAADPTSGGLHVVEGSAQAAAASIDWEERQFLEEVRVTALDRGETLLRVGLAAFVDPASSDTIARGVVRGG